MEYYLGLDMGTTSVGWAVTDTDYNIVRKKGRDFWGIREFDEANTAVDRRAKRISRRRSQREQVRIGLLKSYFSDEILKYDKDFFSRLDNSFFYKEDKAPELKSLNGIFDDSDYKDVDYYKDYPTIFHLRKAIINGEVPVNDRYSRLVFLALLNMYKHRGHFFNGSLDDNSQAGGISELYPRFVDMVDEKINLSFPCGIEDSLEDILSDKKLSKSKKVDEIFSLCGFTSSNKIEKIIIKAICGLQISDTDARKLFPELDTEEKITIKFSDYNYDEKTEDIAKNIGESNYELIELMKQIYDAGVLANILKGKDYLSYARVAEYEKHKSDLALLKKTYRKLDLLDEYETMFRKDEGGTYSAYVNSVNSEGSSRVRRSMGNRTREDLYARIKKDLSKFEEDENVKRILTEIGNETFLPKQLTPGNGVIPNQVHKKEMRAILTEATKHLAFLESKDESGLSVSERILALFSFQIPYYVGPVYQNEKQKGNGWAIRKENGEGQILPWNINEKIDMEATQEEFIKRLIRECSYIHGEKVLPKTSLIYEKYCVLNEINNLKIDGINIDVVLKQDIYNDLFCAKSKVSKSDIVKMLVSRGAIKEASELSGIDVNINNNLSSYHKFKTIFGDDIKKDRYVQASERIIELSTIYGDSKKTLKDILHKEFGDILDESKIKRILGYKFKDWGRLSRAFLEMEGCNKETGEAITVISALWDSQYNLMELINQDAFTFKEVLEEKKYKAESSLREIRYEDLDEMYFSAPVKRMVWQTILLIKEIVKVMGCPPKRIFIEMTRSEGEKGDKGRTKSRANQLRELYKNISDEKRDWEKEIGTAETDGFLNSKKLYLYYLQMGRCMYTNETIDLDELMTNKYDIDHIYPRHFVKDDNISNNLVLVDKEKNIRKSDNYPVEGVSQAAKDHWKFLHSKGFMSDEKYKRLTCRSPFTEEQKEGFIARQLVETSQGTKGIADLLKQLLPQNETTLVYSKAGNVSDFRRGIQYKASDWDNERDTIKFLKSRALNDFHHAKDAYLNIVVGNVYFTKFTQNVSHFIKKEYATDSKKYHYNLAKMYVWEVSRNGEVAWTPGEMGTIHTVKKVMEKNTPLISRLTFEQRGQISDETLSPAKKATADRYIPLKGADKRFADVTKYGGFTSVSGAYFFVVEHEEKKNRIVTIEQVPIYLKNRVESESNGLEKYCKEILGLKDPVICVKKIPFQTLIEIDGFRMRLSGRTGDRIILRNEVQLCLSGEDGNYIHSLEKYKETGRLATYVNKEGNEKLYNILIDKHAHRIFSKRKNPVGELLTNGKALFEKLSVEEQIKVIMEIISLSNTGPTSADLKNIGGSKSSGVMLNSKNLSKSKSIKIISQSVTGLYESVIYELENSSNS